VFGLPKFSGNALFQADPPHWCDASFKYVRWLACSGSLARSLCFGFAHRGKDSSRLTTFPVRRPSPFNPHTFPCKPYWVWRDSEFMIDMSGDKDEEGERSTALL
jgi:hypothetical protein